MAYAALVSLLQTTYQILNFDPYFFPCTKKQIESFRETVDSLLEFVDNCSPNTDRIPTINNLLIKTRDAAYEAEDVFESIIANHFRRNLASNEYGLFEILPQSLEKVMKEIDLMKEEAKKIADGGGILMRRISTLNTSSRSFSSGTKTVSALDNDLMMEIMEQLAGGQSNLEIVPIVGMGGIGKTTLARTLFNSRLIMESFEIRAWVTVSQEYRVQQLVSGLLNQVGVDLTKEKNRSKMDLQLRLYQILCDRRYLIVLDDVWHNQAWDDIKMLFPVNDNRSRIVLTTRHSKVASYANSDRPYHELKLLKEDVSWRLLCQELFGQQDCPSELVETGMEIARNCKGLPLAVSVIGGLLSVENMTKDYWTYVAENIRSILTTSDEQCLEILSLSYNYLPHHLKSCFLYFGIFQEDKEIHVSTLIDLWVAEGFLIPLNSKSMEELGKECLQDLIDRNLILVHRYGSYGKPKSCGIHDLLRDLCVREAQKEKFLFVLNRSVHFHPEEANGQRQLSYHPNVISNNDSDLDDDSGSCANTSTGNSGFVDDDQSASSNDTSNHDAGSAEDDQSLSSNDASENDIEDLCNVMQLMPFIRSYMHPAVYPPKTAIIIGSGLVKVLDVHPHSEQFPLEILELVNLRYLALGVVVEVPSLIYRLWNLQTLKAFHIETPEGLQFDIWEMPQLRHLRFKYISIPNADNGGKQSHVLNNLETLSEIINFRCTEEVITRIPNVRKLSVAYVDKVLDWSYYCLNNLVGLYELESLSLDFCMVSNETLTQNLAFPSLLKKLVLEGCKIPWEDMTIVGMLPNLEVLKLKRKACKGPVWEPNEEEFKHLKFLLIEKPDGLVQWRAENIHFPCLQHLVIRKCYDLEEIPSGMGEIPTIKIVELYQCSPEADSSAKEIFGEDSDIKLNIDPRRETDNVSSDYSFSSSDEDDADDDDDDDADDDDAEDDDDDDADDDNDADDDDDNANDDDDDDNANDDDDDDNADDDDYDDGENLIDDLCDKLRVRLWISRKVYHDVFH